jgi:hypothetical protein
MLHSTSHEQLRPAQEGPAAHAIAVKDEEAAAEEKWDVAQRSTGRARGAHGAHGAHGQAPETPRSHLAQGARWGDADESLLTPHPMAEPASPRLQVLHDILLDILLRALPCFSVRFRGCLLSPSHVHCHISPSLCPRCTSRHSIRYLDSKTMH